METVKLKGSCLCGEVSFKYIGVARVFQYCHCSRCKKFTGSAHAANIIGEPESFEWLTGESSVGRFELPEANHFATCFCKKCGSSLPWKTKSNKAVVIPAGSLDEDPKTRPKHNIFYENKAPWYINVDDLKKFDGLPTK